MYGFTNYGDMTQVLCDAQDKILDFPNVSTGPFQKKCLFIGGNQSHRLFRKTCKELQVTDGTSRKSQRVFPKLRDSHVTRRTFHSRSTTHTSSTINSKVFAIEYYTRGVEEQAQVILGNFAVQFNQKTRFGVKKDEEPFVQVFLTNKLS